MWLYISQEVTARSKYTLTSSMPPKFWQNGLRTTKSRCLKWPSPSPDLNPMEKFVSRTEKACVINQAFKPDSVTPILFGGTAKTPATYREKLVEGCPKCLTQVKSFNAIK